MTQDSHTVNKASKLRFLWIAFATGVLTFYSSCRIILSSFSKSGNRILVDTIMTKWAKRLLKLVNARVSVKNRINIPNRADKPVIFMCNHGSLYDIPVAIRALEVSLRFVAKRELYRIPILSSALRAADFVSIDRHNHDQAIKDLADAKQKMLNGITLWIAPEGTRSQDGRLGPLKRGGFHLAIETNALIVPVVIKNIHKLQAGNDLTLYLNQTIDVEVCESVDAAEFSKENRKQLVDLVRSKMLIALGQD